ncbi:UPF0489 family protein [Longimicrobium terrae]|uniref:Uncharacterized protein n=1 Tax=Longimicrobium terrae TaxID=1639882 RepID=A0A841GWG1_9BACT|nr:hypothetical protein [Longimicrobium terrae]MBB6070398.1 hypothetical protein [Longimicrobium terrae]NNC30892.1 hypothetical protein [Longimicrobium terrae]
MHVLDLDLDFFLDCAPSRHPEGLRLDTEEGESLYTPWDEESFRRFLTTACGLSTERKTPGRVVRHHDEAFYCWRELIRRELLKTPFVISHVDSHSDLGMGDTSHVYIMGELLHRPVEQRWVPDRTKVTPGSYLSYVAACRWPSRIEFVRHPSHHEDRPPHWFRDHDLSTDLLELQCCDLADMQWRASHGGNPSRSRPLWLEPPIPVVFSDYCWDYRVPEPVDFVVLAQSPDYTPTAADHLISVFREYIVED